MKARAIACVCPEDSCSTCSETDKEYSEFIRNVKGIKMTETITQIGLAMEYFTTHPNLPIKHSEVIDWIAKEYEERTGRKFRYPGPAIRRLAQEGKLVRLRRGVYKYDPDLITNPELEDFTRTQREQIFKRDDYCCVMCGKERREGVEIHADLIKPKDLGGKVIIENGQTLCATHNFHKKNLKQTDSGKNMFRLCLHCASY